MQGAYDWQERDGSVVRMVEKNLLRHGVAKHYFRALRALSWSSLFGSESSLEFKRVSEPRCGRALPHLKRLQEVTADQTTDHKDKVHAASQTNVRQKLVALRQT